MSNEEMFTWSEGDSAGKAEAFSKAADSINSYTGLSKSQGSHYRHFIDIEPNRSVKPGFTSQDYYAFNQTKQFLISNVELFACAWTHTIRLVLSETSLT